MKIGELTGRSLRRIARAAGVSMGDVADAAGWRVTQVSDLERTDGPIPATEAVHYVWALGEVLKARETPPKPLPGA